MFCTFELYKTDVIMKDYKVSISELRDNLKEYINLVTAGNAIYVTKRGEVIAELKKVSPENDEDAAYAERLHKYQNGGITLLEDIVNQPLKNEDFIEDDMYISSSDQS